MGKYCQCCKNEYSEFSMRGDLCIPCYEFQEYKEGIILELKEKIKQMKKQTVKIAYSKTIREFARLIDDINWFDKNKRKVNVKTLINKQYKEICENYKEFLGE